MAKFILLSVSIAVASIFVVQNTTPFAVSFLFWRLNASLATVLFLCFLAGALMGAVATYRLQMMWFKKKRYSIDLDKLERLWC